MKSPHLLLTGATGLIGRGWLDVFLRRHPDRSVTVLARDPRKIDDARVRSVRGDLALPNLGLEQSTRASLVESITEIIHCASDIRFTLPLDRARSVNTMGTARVLDLARACKHLNKFAHVGTAYIMGRTPGILPEAPFLNETAFFNTYQQSKYEAERLVIDAMNDIPAAVFRLSSIIGDSQTGAIEQFNYFHQLLRLIPGNPLTLIPGDPGAPVDLIANDWAVAALSELYESSFETGRIFNVCAGSENSMTATQALSLAFKNTGETPPELVTTGAFERFTKSNPHLRRIVSAVEHFLPQLAIRQHFDSDATLMLLDARGIVFPKIETYFSKVVANCLRERPASIRFAGLRPVRAPHPIPQA